MKTVKALIARSNCEPQMGSMQEAKGKGRRQKSRHGRIGSHCNQSLAGDCERKRRTYCSLWETLMPFRSAKAALIV